MSKSAAKHYEFQGKTRLIASFLLGIFIPSISPISLYAQEVPVKSEIRTESLITERNESKEVLITVNEGGKIVLGDASIEIPEGALKEDTKISITRLSSVEETGESLYNAIPKAGGYRFLPAGTQFEKDVTITLPYSPELDSKPQSLDELYTYFFDKQKKMWVKLERLEVDTQQHVVRSLTTHFTDMINATLTLPESASPVDVNLNSIKNLEAAKPDCHLIKFNPPKASNTGDATFSFELAVPAGRRGMQPQISISYSSAGGNGIMGKGFDVSYGSCITTDTRFGLPKYDTNDQYMLDGILLDEDKYNHPRNNGTIYYAPQKETQFSRIRRFCAGTENDWWEVTDKSGTKRLYKQTETSCTGGGTETFTWNLTQMVDVHGNSVIYEYEKNEGYVYPKQICYTGYGNKKGNYRVEFHYDEDENGNRKDIRIEARSKQLISCKRLLTGITTHYGSSNKPIRSYSFKYKEGLAKEKMLTALCVSNNAGEGYEYTFDYTEPKTDTEGNIEYFESIKEWTGGNAIQTGNSTSSGANFNGSAGVGYGTMTQDIRITGGASGSVSSGESYTEDTMLDINGDGKPDAVYQDGNTVYVCLNNGNGFEEKTPIKVRGATFDGEIDHEENTSSSVAWNIYGGAGAKSDTVSFSSGAGYSEVYQKTTSSVYCSFMDMDRDGLCDIVETGNEYYLRNMGDLTFEKAYIGSKVEVTNVEQIITRADRNDYQQTYYVQNPFRMWKAPYEGIISIKETLKKVTDDYNLKADVKAKTFTGNEADDFEIKIRQNDKNQVDYSKSNLTIEKDRDFYFIANAGSEPLNTDIDWNINIGYSDIKVLKKGYPAPVFVPEIIKASQSQDFPLNGLTDIVELQVSCKSSFIADLEKSILADMYCTNTSTYTKEQKKEGTNETEIVSFCTIKVFYSEKWKKESENKKQIYDYLIQNGYFIPTVFTPEEFEEYLTELKSQNFEVADNYYESFASNFVHSVTDNLFILKSFGDLSTKINFYKHYPLSIELKKKCLEKYNAVDLNTSFSDQCSIYSVSKEYLIPDEQKRSEVAVGSVFEKEGKPCYVVAFMDKNGDRVPVIYNTQDKILECGGSTLDGFVAEKSEVSTDKSHAVITLAYNKDCCETPESHITFTVSGISYRPENLTASEFNKILNHIEVANTDVQDVYWNWEKDKTVTEEEMENLFKGMNLSGDEKNIIISALYEQGSEEDSDDFYYTIKDEPDYEKAQRILNSYKYKTVMEKSFPFYELQENGDYKLKEEWKKEKSKSDFSGENEADIKTKYEAYKKLNDLLVDECRTFNFGKAGKITCLIEYENEHLYQMNGTTESGSSSSPMMQLNTATDMDETICFVTKDFNVNKTIWNSRADFSSENTAENWKVYPNFSKGDTAYGKDEKENEDIFISNDEFLYGGKNNWFYGVWKSTWTEDDSGCHEDNPFSIGKLRGFLKSTDEITSKTDFENKKAEKENSNTDNPKKEDNKSDIHFYLPCSKADNQQISEVTRLKNDAVKYPVNLDQAVLGTVSVNTLLKRTAAGKVPVTEYYMPFISGDILHADRAGGVSYYNVEGLYKESTTNTNSSNNIQNMRIPAIRKTYTTGTDRTPNVKISIGAKPNADQAKNDVTGDGSGASLKGFELSGTLGHNHSVSDVRQTFQDINADGIPDIVQVKGSSGVSAILSSEIKDGKVIYENERDFSELSVLGKSTSETEVMGASVGPAGNVGVIPKGVKVMTSNPDMKASPAPSGGTTKTTGTNKQNEGLSDINGDGLCDYYADGKYKLNTGTGFVTDEINFQKNDYLTEGVNQGYGMNFSLGYGANLGQSDSLICSGSVNLGMTYGFSSSNTEKMMMDINGDGLPDILHMCAGSNILKVRYNTGASFTKEASVAVPGWGEVVTDHIQYFVDYSDNHGYDLGFIENIPVVGSILKGTVGEIDINPMGLLAGRNANALDWSGNTNISFSGSVGVNFNIPINIYIYPVGYVGTINITISGGAGVNGSASVNCASVKMMDLDGDGLPDHVLRIPCYGTYWKRNKSGKYGQLNQINLPQGGNVQIEYAEKYGTVNNPNFKYVMSRVTMNDGTDGKGLLPKLEHGAHSVTTSYQYDGGYYDRSRKDFFGFASVVTTFADGTYQTDEYNVSEYYAKGSLEKSSMYSKDGTELSRSITSLIGAPYALPEKEESWIFEKEGDGSFIHTINHYTYDDYGNCTQIIQDYGEGVQLTGEIEYDNLNTSDYIIGLPVDILVYGNAGSSRPLRHRHGIYDDLGQLKELWQYYDEDNYSVNKLSYDEYGNIKSVSDSRGATLSYVYDEIENMFVREITQSGNNTDSYTGKIDYDIPTQTKISETDCNGNKLSYKYDAWQRITEIWTSYDEGGNTPAIKYEYHCSEMNDDGQAELWYAVTDNKVTFDAQDGSVIKTVLQVDGLGRAVRTAKTGFVNGEDGWNASGAVKYDIKGRTEEEGMTEFIKGNLKELLETTPRMTALTTSYKYDEKDRKIETKLPDGNVQYAGFKMQNGKLISSSIDPLGNVSIQETDSRGNITRVAKEDNSGKQLTQVTYQYNEMGEMLKAFDAKGTYPVSVEYDLLGRKTAIESKDSGRQEFFYDECSNLVHENNSVLREHGKQIIYKYDGLNRLIKIDYPDTEDTDYIYGGAGDTHGAAGKILCVTDASGKLEYEYGELGEVTKETRTLATHLNGPRLTETAVTEYRSDYLGRMQWIIYPDGETVTYGYDNGGQVVSVTGRHYDQDFNYVTNILYDEYGQRTRIDYGNETFTEYTYDPARRWLSSIITENKWGQIYQNIIYDFDAVGNINWYENNCLDSVNGNYKTRQRYTYDKLYQLIEVNGDTTYNPYQSVVPEFTSNYKQTFTFSDDGLCNMNDKVSEELVSPNISIGDNLNYSIHYEYDENYSHRLIQAGSRYYKYDENGNIICEQEGPFGVEDPSPYWKIKEEAEDVYSTDYAWGYHDAAKAGKKNPQNSRIYTWDERNQLISAVDSSCSVAFVYGQDGQRANKYTASSETLYFNKMWTLHTDSGNRSSGGQFAKNIYLGETRIVTKLAGYDQHTVHEETYKQYYYHSDHLGSASLISDYKGDEYQRIEYTPYGETWVEKTQNIGSEFLPYKFTAKELDEETGLYYYGARYLDPKYSRWISTDPALGDYIPQASINDEARKNNQNLPGMGGIFNHINCNLYAYAANNPVHYIDPDGNDIINASRQLMQDAGDETLGSSRTKIKDEGCVLTAYTRMASAIIGTDISLKKANEIGVKNGLFTGQNKNLLTPENGAALVNAILKEFGVTDTTISFDGSYEGQDAVTKYQDSNSSESKYFSTIRVGTHDAKGNKYDHTMNLDKDAYICSNCGDNIKLNDTSGVRSQLADDPSGRKNTFKRMDFFKINTTQSNSQE